MKSLPASSVFSPTLFSYFEPSQPASGWHTAGLNGSHHHDEASYAKPPPIAVRNFPRARRAKTTPRQQPHTCNRVTGIAANAIRHAASEHVVLGECRGEAAVKNLSVRGPVVDGNADQSRHIRLSARRHLVDSHPKNLSQ